MKNIIDAFYTESTIYVAIKGNDSYIPVKADYLDILDSIDAEIEELSPDFELINGTPSEEFDFTAEDLALYLSSINWSFKASERSVIFATAWTYIRKNIAANLSEALKMAWKRSKVLKALRNGIAYFTFAKSSGELRPAIGTLRTGNFNYTYKTNEAKGAKLDVVKYYDIEAKGWRSFRIERLQSIAA